MLAVNTPVLALPLVGSLPDHPPDAVHAVASEEVHVSVAPEPALTVLGVTPSVTEGGVDELELCDELCDELELCVELELRDSLELWDALDELVPLEDGVSVAGFADDDVEVEGGCKADPPTF